MTLQRLRLAAAVFLLAGGAAADPVTGTPQTLRPHHAPRTYAAPRLAPARVLSVPARPYGGTPVDVLTYHYDNYRSGWNATETDLTPASVGSAKFGLLATLHTPGNVFAQPLVVTNVTMPAGGARDLLIVATGKNTVYAYDAKTYALLWSRNLGTPQDSDHVGCGDVRPEYGISSTPLVVRNGAGAATLYVVAATENSPYAFKSTLYALSAADGTNAVAPVDIAPFARLSDGSRIRFDPQNQWNRAGLAGYNGQLYVAIGSHCDINAGNISGWLLRYDATTLTLQKAFNTIGADTNYKLASIWMTGFAPAIDPAGNVFLVTGNGDFTPGARTWGESILKFGPAGAITSRFTPANYDYLNSGDTDFGSGGIMLLPQVTGQVAPPLAVAAGKEGRVVLLNQTRLGGATANDRGVLGQQFIGGVWGGPAFYNGPGGPTVFYQGDGDALRAFSVSTGKARPSLSLALSGTSSAGYGGSFPVVSSNAGNADTGVVWLIHRGHIYGLEAYDAGRLGDPIFSANGGSWSNCCDDNPFLTPIVANGRVYVPGYNHVQVFGLAQ